MRVSSDSGSSDSLDGRNSDSGANSVGQTNNIPRSTSVTSGAAKVFREFKWGLLTLFLLMVVVIGLVYDGGRKKKTADADKLKTPDAGPEITLDAAPESGAPPSTQVAASPAPSPNVSNTPNTPVVQVGTSAGPSIPAVPQPRPVFNAHPTTAPIVDSGAPITDPVETPTHDNPPVHLPVANSGAERTYVVKPGDTLTKIANSMLPGKGGVKAILDMNKDVMPDANMLRVGVSLKIPAGLPAAAESHDKKVALNGNDKTTPAHSVKEGKDGKVAADLKDTKEPKEPKEKDVASSSIPGEYVVQSGDTLERIARKVFNDGRKWREIYEWNREQLSDPSRLRAGQTLKLKHGGSSPGTTTTNLTPPPPVPAENRKHNSVTEAQPVTPEAENRAHNSVSEAKTAAQEAEQETQVMSRNSSASFP